MSEKHLEKLAVTKKMIAWNLTGCVVNALQSFFMMAVVTRNAGLEETGYFSIALATAQLLLTFGRYGVRAYQVTDIKEEIRAGSYLYHRAVTAAGMIVFAYFFVNRIGYPVYKGKIVLYVCACKAVDAVEDVFHGEMQRCGKLDIAGKLLTYRSLLTLFLFWGFVTGGCNIAESCWMTFLLSFLFCISANSLAAKRWVKKEWKEALQADILGIKRLFRNCFPLFAAQFLSLLIYQMPKYMIDRFESSEVQAIYSILFMPAFVINLISEFIFKPLLTPLSMYWENGNRNIVYKTMIKLFLAIAATTLAAITGGYIVGISLLEWFYQVSLQAYQKVFLLLLLGGGFTAAVYLSGNLLTMMRKTGTVLSGYLFGILFLSAIMGEMVKKNGILGASWAYLLTEAVMALYFSCCLFYSGK